MSLTSMARLPTANLEKKVSKQAEIAKNKNLRVQNSRMKNHIK